MALRVVSRMAEGPAGIHDAEVLGESEVAFLEDAPPAPAPATHTHTHPFTPTKQSNARIPESRDSVLQPAFQQSFDRMTQSP